MGILTKRNVVYILFVFVSILKLNSAELLWDCTVQDECAELQGSDCKNGYCVCEPGMEMNEDNTKCVPVKKEAPYINSPCEEDSECRRLITGFECHEETKTCVCRDGFHYLRGRCWLSVGFGENCVASTQCHDPIQPLGMECSDGVCICKRNYYQREPSGECRRKALALGDGCVVDEDCHIEDYPEAVCDLVTLACVEPEDVNVTLIETDDQTSSANIIHSASQYQGEYLGQECIKNSDCENIGPAFCSTMRVCVCNRGYYPVNNFTKCFAEQGIHSPADGTCSGFFATVLDEVCSCPPGFYYSHPFRDCRKPSRRFGESCNDDLSCRTFGISAYCATQPSGLRECQCDETVSTTNIEKQLCESVSVFIGDPCETNENCPSSSECVDNICSCTNGTIPDPSMIRCLPTGLVLGEDCTFSGQCDGTENAACVNRVCQCAEGFLESSDELTEENICIAGINGPCRDTEDCVILNSECVVVEESGDEPQKQCKCVSGYIHESDECHKLATNINGDCERNVQCYSLGNSSSISCANGKCNCLPRYHFRDGMCNEQKALGEFCRSTSQCFIFGDIENSECRNSLCQCIPGYRATYNPDRCNSAISTRSFMWIVVLALLTKLLIRPGL